MADQARVNEDIKANEQNRKNYLGHYLLNPYVQGPVREAGNRLSRRENSFLAENPWYEAVRLAAPIVGGVAGAAHGYADNPWYASESTKMQRSLLEGGGAALGSLALSNILPMALGDEYYQDNLTSDTGRELARLRKHSSVGPYDIERIRHQKGLEDSKLLMDDILEKRTVSAVLNPYVKGIGSLVKNKLDRGYNEATYRYPYLLKGLEGAAEASAGALAPHTLSEIPSTLPQMLLANQIGNAVRLSSSILGSDLSRNELAKRYKDL
jgi:hypothetical protein